MRVSRRAVRGFSMLELVIVVAMSLVVAAIAVPNFMTVIFNFRLRGAMSSLSGLLQNCRMTAVQKNTIMTSEFGVLPPGGPVAYIKHAGDTSAMAATDPQVQLGSPLTQITTPSGTGAPSALDSTTLGFTPLTYQPSSYLPGFNSRGLPCKWDVSTSVCSTGVGYVFYFTDSRPLGKSGWAAVTISPAGRVKTWSWNGANWVN
ncbi:MAG TPA: prepilin-type N-terminal cleavage/methylation domain-containing protein [Terriglobales bacterium]|nr:prepilin-type N-terminal cleavage/methylation domain-containing protein [Terriglobales bacterium]